MLLCVVAVTQGAQPREGKRIFVSTRSWILLNSALLCLGAQPREGKRICWNFVHFFPPSQHHSSGSLTQPRLAAVRKWQLWFSIWRVKKLWETPLSYTKMLRLTCRCLSLISFRLSEYFYEVKFFIKVLFSKLLNSGNFGIGLNPDRIKWIKLNLCGVLALGRGRIRNLCMFSKAKGHEVITGLRFVM